MSQAWHEPVHAVSQQIPSGAQVVPLAQPAATVWQAWPFLLLHVPVASQVPAQWPDGSSCPAIATHAWLDAQVWQGPGQSVAVVQAPPASGSWMGTSGGVMASGPATETSVVVMTSGPAVRHCLVDCGGIVCAIGWHVFAVDDGALVESRRRIDAISVATADAVDGGSFVQRSSRIDASAIDAFGADARCRWCSADTDKALGAVRGLCAGDLGHVRAVETAGNKRRGKRGKENPRR